MLEFDQPTPDGLDAIETRKVETIAKTTEPFNKVWDYLQEEHDAEIEKAEGLEVVAPADTSWKTIVVFKLDVGDYSDLTVVLDDGEALGAGAWIEWVDQDEDTRTVKTVDLVDGEVVTGEELYTIPDPDGLSDTMGVHPYLQNRL